MNNKRTIVVAEDKKEYCVVCWGETPYTKNTHIDYVGQICEKCRENIYSKTITIERKSFGNRIDTVIISNPSYRFTTKVASSVSNSQIRKAVIRLIEADLFHHLDEYFETALLGNPLPTQRQRDIIDHDLVGIVS